MQLSATSLTAEERALQLEVREYLNERLPVGSYPVGLGMNGAFDPEFSRDLGAMGWLGMSLPAEYGGGKSAVERLIVVEELLARGAPVGAHWVADRQSGPSIAAHGTPEQKQRFLPRIARGEISFAIGMSEPDAGSDLAAVRTKATPTEGGWLINGSKIWTSGAHVVDYMLCLFRTSDDKHGGLTQFILDRESAGIDIEPITFIDGHADFCLVTFTDVFVPDENRLGEVGSGWGQNKGELVLERGGVDRWMSAMPVLQNWVASRAGTQGEPDAHAAADLGSIVARCWAFHGMSLAVARMVDAGKYPMTEAALVKDMATRFEQGCIDIVVKHLGRMPRLDSDDPAEALLAQAVLVKPSWTIRGGTTEILHSLIAKELNR